LYHHPEMQRTYISRLLKGIEALKLKKIKSINIILSTHSPFILSDIPSKNILRLGKEEGLTSKGILSDTQTFGANIHDLLANDFFLKSGFMGEFAKSKINEVINFMNHKKCDQKIAGLKENSKETEEEKVKRTKQLQRQIKIKSDLDPLTENLSINDTRKIIQLIGEPFLKQNLLRQYNDLLEPDQQDLDEEELLKRLAVKYDYNLKKKNK